MKNIINIIKETFVHWNERNSARMGASLSFYAILSMAPIFIVLITVVGLFFSTEFVENRILYQISNIVGSNLTNQIGEMINIRASEIGTSLSAWIIGFGTLLYGTLGGFRELNYSINKIWSEDFENKPKRSRKYRQLFIFIKNHIPTFITISLLAFIFLITIIGSLVFQIVGEYMSAIYPNTFDMIKFIEPILSFIFVALFFGTIYRVLPKIKLPFPEIAFGASVTAIIFLIGELLIGSYLNYFVDGGVVGTALSVISIMLWVYFSAQVFFFGASFTYIYSKKYGSLRKAVIKN